MRSHLCRVRVAVALAQRLERLAKNLVFRRSDVEGQHVNHLVRQVPGHLFHQQRPDDRITGEDDVVQRLVANGAVEHVGHLLDVVEVKVLVVALVPRLRPAAHRRSPRLDVSYLSLSFAGAKTKDVQPRGVRISQQSGIAWELIVHSHQRVEVRHRSDEQPSASTRTSSWTASKKSSSAEQANTASPSADFRRSVSRYVRIRSASRSKLFRASPFSNRGRSVNALRKKVSHVRRPCSLDRRSRYRLKTGAFGRFKGGQPVELPTERGLQRGRCLGHAEERGKRCAVRRSALREGGSRTGYVSTRTMRPAAARRRRS